MYSSISPLEYFGGCQLQFYCKKHSHIEWYEDMCLFLVVESVCERVLSQGLSHYAVCLYDKRTSTRRN